MELQERPSSLFVIPLVLLFVASFLLIALIHHQSELSLLSLLVLGLAIGTKLWAKISLSKISLLCQVHRKRLFPDENLTLKIHLINGKFLPVWIQIRVPVEGVKWTSLQEKEFHKGIGLLWYQRVSIEKQFIFPKRGVYGIGPIQISAGDLLGFFSSQKKIEPNIEIIVYPRIIPLKNIQLPKEDLFGMPGVKSPVEDPIYIMGTHDYQPWQPSKYIHWKASAHRSHLQSKIFEPSAQEKVLFLIQVDQFVAKGAEVEFEETLEGVASLAFRLYQQGRAIGLMTNGKVQGDEDPFIPVNRNSHQLQRILEVLARLKMEVSSDFFDLIKKQPKILWDTSIIYFSYEENAEVNKFLISFYPGTPMICYFFQSFTSEKTGKRFSLNIHDLREVYLR